MHGTAISTDVSDIIATSTDSTATDSTVTDSTVTEKATGRGCTSEIRWSQACQQLAQDY